MIAIITIAACADEGADLSQGCSDPGCRTCNRLQLTANRARSEPSAPNRTGFVPVQVALRVRSKRLPSALASGPRSRRRKGNKWDPLEFVARNRPRFQAPHGDHLIAGCEVLLMDAFARTSSDLRCNGWRSRRRCCGPPCRSRGVRSPRFSGSSPRRRWRVRSFPCPPPR
jgi:hypothetical protein